MDGLILETKSVMAATANKKEDTIVHISVSCRNLRSRDRFSHSDPLCVLYTKSGVRGCWQEVGRSEVVKNTGDPEWQTSFTLTYYFHHKQELRFVVFDQDSDSSDLAAHDNLGTAECSLGQILSTNHNKLEVPLSPYRSVPGDCGLLLARAQEISDGTRDTVTLDLTAQNLDKKDLFSESDPFYTISRYNKDDATDTLVYRSEWIKDTASPDWKPVTMSCAKLCGGDWIRPLKIEIYDWDSDGGHDFIGEFTTTLDELSEGEGYQILQFPVINHKKATKKGSEYENSGEIIVKSVQIDQDSTFLDYIRGGLKLKFAVAVDFSLNNCDPCLGTRSLHRLNPNNGENAYTMGMRAVGEVIQDYVIDKNYIGLGFGGEVGGRTSQCFPLNGRSRDPYCQGVEGLVQGYLDSLREVPLSSPTRFAPVIQYMADQADKMVAGEEYLVLLLVTGGGLTDIADTKATLVKNSNQPFSVVLVGIGDGDMGALVQLDADRARLCSGDVQAARDIVQFVHFNKYIPDGFISENYRDMMDPSEAKLKLAKAALAEIPRQVTEYLQKAGVTPGVAEIPQPVDFDQFKF